MPAVNQQGIKIMEQEPKIKSPERLALEAELKMIASSVTDEEILKSAIGLLRAHQKKNQDSQK